MTLRRKTTEEEKGAKWDVGQIVAGVMAILSSIGAATAVLERGEAAQSAKKAQSAQFVTVEKAEAFKALFKSVQDQQQQNIRKLASLEAKIQILEEAVSESVEGSGRRKRP